VQCGSCSTPAALRDPHQKSTGDCNFLQALSSCLSPVLTLAASALTRKLGDATALQRLGALKPHHMRWIMRTAHVTKLAQSDWMHALDSRTCLEVQLQRMDAAGTVKYSIYARPLRPRLVLSCNETCGNYL
jgi:hypothetical protein